MKIKMYAKLVIMSCFTINLMQTMIQANHVHKDRTTSIMTYLYSSLWPSTPPTIPAATNASKKTIIFDLDGVLCSTNDLQAFYEIGVNTIFSYLVKHGKPSIKDLFDALQDTPAISTTDAYNDGLRMPNIMIDWQTGAQSLHDIQDAMVKQILENKKLTIESKNWLINTVLMMTTPEKFIATRQIIHAGVDLLRTLQRKGYKLYILSNWDRHSFALFQRKFPDLFMLDGQPIFDGIMISGKVGLAKPDAAIYKKCLSKFNIAPSDAIFIDDTIENIQAAEQLGISSIHCQNKNIADVIQQLIKILAST